jgi:hypothetical protein
MMTRLACFYNHLDPRTEAALQRFAPQAGLTVEWVDTSGSLQVYADELARRWQGTEDLILVEQDKEIHGSCLPEMLGCAELWCGWTYWILPEPHTTLVIGGFGVVRFSARVQQMIPVAEFRGESQLNIDRRFDLALLRHGTRCHLHGHVAHHHVYEPRPARVREHVAGLRDTGMLGPPLCPPAPGPGLLPGSYRLPGR